MSGQSRQLDAVYDACISRLEEYEILGFIAQTFVHQHPMSAMIHQGWIRRDDPSFKEDGRKLREAARRELRRSLEGLTKEELAQVLYRVPPQLQRLKKETLLEFLERHIVFDCVDLVMGRNLAPIADADSLV